MDRAKEDLAAQIKRVLEPGYKPRNPILDAIGLITLEASKDPTQRTLATLTREIQNLRGDVAALQSGSLNAMPRNALAYLDGFAITLEDFQKANALLKANVLLAREWETGPTGPRRDSKQKEDERGKP